MDIHLLDDRLRRVAVVDVYSSLIWTERFQDYGDFVLELESTDANRRLLSEGTWFVIPGSYRVMMIETVESNTSAENERVLKVTGRSIEALLDDRVAMSSLTGDASRRWALTGLPNAVAKTIFKTICVDGALSTLDKLPYYSANAFLPLGTIPVYPDEVKFELEIETVYVLIKKICEIYNLGFRLVRNETVRTAPTLHFDIYSGTDHSTSQSSTNAVVFDEELENLSNVTELTSSAGNKNVAYVIGKNKTLEVFADGVDITSAGFQRRVLVVKADDITLPIGTALDSALAQRGREELAQYRSIQALDGEISENSSYRYGVDYSLGDLIEVRGSGGLANDMRVTEQIFVCDDTGTRSYPTLSLNQTLMPETWSTWPGQRVWFDLPETDFWHTI